jgi:hypothetical protein
MGSIFTNTSCTRWAFSLLVLLLLSFFFESTQAWQGQDQDLCVMELQDLEETESSESEDEGNEFQFFCFSSLQINLERTVKSNTTVVEASPQKALKEVDLPPPRV